LIYKGKYFEIEVKQQMSKEEYIKNARMQLGLSQKEMAALLNIDQASLCSYEKGTRRPSPKSIRKIVDGLKGMGINIDYVDLMDN
jgi:transcriptional regulator with XRE-family HTH domain